jgi:hypothetical protein
VTVGANPTHAVAGGEIPSGVSDEFAGRRMIGCLHSDDRGRKAWVVLVDERHELVLRSRRSDDEDRVEALEPLRDVAKETPCIVRVLPRLTAPARMTMHPVLRCQQPGLVGGVGMEVKGPRFRMVDPDDRMRHGLILFV